MTLKRLFNWGNLAIILYWVLAVSFMSAIGQYSVRIAGGFTKIPEEFFANPFVAYWLSPHQYLEASLFGVFFGIWFIAIEHLSRRWQIERKGFLQVILLKSGIYLLGFSLSATLIYFILELAGFYSPEVISGVVFDRNMVILLSLAIGGLIVQLILLNFIIQTIKNVGKHNLSRFLTGKYRRPIREDRTFMFLDMRSSTAIAERLGHILYSRLIRDCFADVNFVLEKYSAEVYQYVGDEIIFTWPTDRAVANGRCLDLFFEVRDVFEKRVPYYANKYDVRPEFKAGCHCGMVTATEVGVDRREIAYHGDVMNTSARIQELCNTLGHDLLISRDLKQRLNSAKAWSIEAMGSHHVHGKSHDVDVFAVHRTPSP